MKGHPGRRSIQAIVGLAGIAAILAPTLGCKEKMYEFVSREARDSTRAILDAQGVFHEETGRFSIKPPDGWFAVSASNSAHIFREYPRMLLGDSFKNAVTQGTIPVAFFKDIQRVGLAPCIYVWPMLSTTGQAAAPAPGDEVVEIAGHKATPSSFVTRAANGIGQGVEGKYLQYSVFAGGGLHLYLVNYHAEPGDFDAQLPQFEAALKSLRINR